MLVHAAPTTAKAASSSALRVPFLTTLWYPVPDVTRFSLLSARVVSYNETLSDTTCIAAVISSPKISRPLKNPVESPPSAGFFRVRPRVCRNRPKMSETEQIHLSSGTLHL